MAWWGKLIGGTLGFMVGGPLGAMLGAAFGHNFDANSRSGRARIVFSAGGQEQTQAAFFTATFSVMGYIAKLDGHVSAREIAMAEQLMQHMQLSATQRKMAINLFDQGKTEQFNLDDVLHQLKQECHRRTTLIRMFVEIQVQAAVADGALDSAERRILEHIAVTLGVAAYDLEQIINMIKGAGAAQTRNNFSVQDAYQILGVTADTSTADIRKAYRRLLSQHHPDKLVSKGLPEEMMKLANEKTHEIRQAWKSIQAARGKSSVD